MKLYELLKDLPTFKAGDVFYLDSNNNLRQKWPDIMAYNHKTLEKFPNILKDWFEEIPEGNMRWRAEEDEAYWNAGSEDPCKYIDYRDSTDSFLYASGNYFKTEEEAEAYKKYLIARQVLLDDAEGGKFVPFKTAYFVRYTFSILISSRWSIDYTINKYSPGKIYFKDAESLKKSLEEHKEQWEIVRKYEMG